MPQAVYVVRFYSTGESWETRVAANEVSARSLAGIRGYTEMVSDFEYRMPEDQSQTATIQRTYLYDVID